MGKLLFMLLGMFISKYYVSGISVGSFKSLVVSRTTETSSEVFQKEGVNEHNLSKTPKIYQMHVTSKITNRFAHTTILSKVKNTAIQSQEVAFSIIIPDTAFISGFIMELNGSNYTAFVKEKEEAKQIYETAIASGQGAGYVFLNARNSNRFTVAVNIEPNSKVAFYLTYEELLNRQDGHYELVINLHPGQLVKDLLVEVTISESRKLMRLRVPPLRSGNEITDENSNLDPKATTRFVNDRNAIVTFSPSMKQQKQLSNNLGRKETEGFCGQFVVQYDVKRDPLGGEVVTQDGYFVHFFAPSELKALPKHVVFILDTSLSMYGQKIVQLRESMTNILEQMNEQDKFNLVEFNSNVKVWNLFEKEKSVWFPCRQDDNCRNISKNNDEQEIFNYIFPEAYEVNADTITKAREAVLTLIPTASTDIYTALKVGLYLVELGKRKRSNHQPIIIFLTDGDPTIRITSTEEIVTKITEYNSGPRRSVIFTLSFGKFADRDFLKKLSARNLGFSRHIYEAADASLQLQHFYTQISSPLLTNVSFKYEPSTTSLTKTDFPIHFLGSEIVVAGLCGTPDLVPPTINGWSQRGWISFRPRVVHSITSVERLWAYLTVKQLLDRKEVSDENQEELRKKALKLSLKYKFVTSVTSLVVVKSNATNNLQLESTYDGDVGSRSSKIAHHYSIAANGNRVVEQKPPAAPHQKYEGTDISNKPVNGKATPHWTKITTSSTPVTEFSLATILSSIPWLNDVLKTEY